MKKVAAIQMTSTLNVDSNLAQTEKLLAQAASQDAFIVVLPEMFAILGDDRQARQRTFEIFGEMGQLQQFLSDQAAKHEFWIVGGTIPIATDVPGKTYASNLVFDPSGKCVARYDKIHLFDATVGSDNNDRYCESEYTLAGDEPMTVDLPFGKLGLSICYDIRFPELFHAMGGVELISVPSAFTAKTGRAHWEVLLRARAIENQAYVVAANQTGDHGDGRHTYGHSMIIDPWGKVLACYPYEVGVITAKINTDYLEEVRQRMPIQQHKKYNKINAL